MVPVIFTSKTISPHFGYRRWQWCNHVLPQSKIQGRDNHWNRYFRKAIEQAQRLHSDHTITFEQANIEKTDYPSNSFDLICAFQNHFHWNNLQGSLLEIRRILTDDGILLIGCEYSKVKYFLPELKEPDVFGEYLGDVGLVQVERERDWVVYGVGKRIR